MLACMGGQTKPRIIAAIKQKKPSGNRHKALAAEKGQVIWQVDFMISVVAVAGNKAVDNASEHTHIDAAIHGFHRVGHDKIADGSGQSRGTRIVSAEANPHTESKEQRPAEPKIAPPHWAMTSPSLANERNITSSQQVCLSQTQ